MNDRAPQSICIFRLSAIGDVCNAVAAVQAIQAKHPQATITWIIGKVEYQLLKGLKDVEFIVFDKRAGKPAVKTFKEQMKRRHFDVLLLMQVAMRANLLSRHIKAKRRIGFDKGRSKELHSLFINERIQAPSRQHVLDGFMAFAQHLGVDPTATPTWHIPIEATDQLIANELQAQGRYAVIVPSASNSERNWLADRYAQVAQYLQSQGERVVLCGGPSEQERILAEQITHSDDQIINLTGHTNLKQLLAILRHASVVIAPDTGPLHMAASQGCKVIGLYGHSNPERTGPYNNLDGVVEVYHQHLHTQTGKRAAELPWGKRVKGQHVMADISVDAVIAKLAPTLAH